MWIDFGGGYCHDAFYDLEERMKLFDKIVDFIGNTHFLIVLLVLNIVFAIFNMAIGAAWVAVINVFAALALSIPLLLEHINKKNE